MLDGRGAYEYSNLGAGLLGHCLSLATGRSFADLLDELFFAPLGMNESSLALSLHPKQDPPNMQSMLTEYRLNRGASTS